jgi:hypothetical protein
MRTLDMPSGAKKTALATVLADTECHWNFGATLLSSALWSGQVYKTCQVTDIALLRALDEWPYMECAVQRDNSDLFPVKADSL